MRPLCNRLYNGLYSGIRSVLFQMDPEKAHDFTLKWLQKSRSLVGLLSPPLLKQPKTIMGLTFPNAVGLAAGFDKNGDCIEGMGALGFGFIEVGTITPKPQLGNPKPRLFRLKSDSAIINRMGFNNKGIDYLCARLKKSRPYYQGIIGVNIGKNADTPLENAVDDYKICFEKVYELADYITLNISSPNTAQLRELQSGLLLEQLLSEMKELQLKLAQSSQRYVPLLVKIAPDLDEIALVALAEKLLAYKIDGVIATNTTVERIALHDTASTQMGGLSGAPLMSLSTQKLARLRQLLGKHMPIIGVGGIMSGADAAMKFQAGADLVQVYTGLIYKGPALLHAIMTAER